MARTGKRLVAGSQLTTSAAVYYTAPTLTSTILRKLSFCNTSASAVTVTVYLVPSGGTAGASNTITSVKSIAANETWSSPDVEGHVLDAGGRIEALASAGSAVTLIASGIEISGS